MHGFQLWVALPKEKEGMAAEFHHISKDALPEWEQDNLKIKLIAGQAFERKSPVPVHSELFMLKIEALEDTSINFNDQLDGEIGIAVVEGSVTACDETVNKGQMLVSNSEGQCAFQVSKGSLLLIFGGKPFPESRTIWWNFVASNPKTIEEAKEKWENGEFDMVPGEKEVIPLPK